jgi:hypothetical protein
MHFSCYKNYKNYTIAQSVSCQLSVQKIDFDPSIVDMTFVVDKVTLRQGFLRVLGILAVSIISLILHTNEFFIFFYLAQHPTSGLGRLFVQVSISQHN